MIYKFEITNSLIISVDEALTEFYRECADSALTTSNRIEVEHIAQQNLRTGVKSDAEFGRRFDDAKEKHILAKQAVKDALVKACNLLSKLLDDRRIVVAESKIFPSGNPFGDVELSPFINPFTRETITEDSLSLTMLVLNNAHIFYAAHEKTFVSGDSIDKRVERVELAVKEAEKFDENGDFKNDITVALNALERFKTNL